MRRLLTTKELAEALGMQPNTLRIWRATGDGPPFIKFGDGRGGRVRYDEERVREFLADREREGR